MSMRLKRAPLVAWPLLTVALILGTARGAPIESATGARAADPLLMIKVQGDSVDFRLIDPQGRIALIGVTDRMCAIPNCDVEKSSDFEEPDEEAADSVATAFAAYGGGCYTLEDPAPGRWRLQALAARACDDSCDVWVCMWSMKYVVQDARCSLRPGEAVTWRVTVAPRTARLGHVWARFKLESRTTVPSQSGRKL
jgi:hypothetical protein